MEAELLLQAMKQSFAKDRALAERAIAQVADADMHKSLSPETNSIVIIMKHIAGNLRSRWTDFLTSDGEKQWRDRDREFIDDYRDRQQLMDDWNQGWQSLFAALDELQPADLGRTVQIRGVDHSVPLAMVRSATHISYHIGQIVMLARIHVGAGWQTLTIERGKSAEYNAENWGKPG